MKQINVINEEERYYSCWRQKFRSVTKSINKQLYLFMINYIYYPLSILMLADMLSLINTNLRLKEAKDFWACSQLGINLE